MASGYTTNLRLNQWDADDYVLHEDFNADNRKIEEKLNQVDASLSRLGIKKLLELETTTPASAIEFDLSALELEDYQYVFLDVLVTANNYGTPVYGRINKQAQALVTFSGSSTTNGIMSEIVSPNQTSRRIIMSTFSDTVGWNRRHTCIYGPEGFMGESAIAGQWSDVETFDLLVGGSDSSKLISSAKIIVWGMR